MGRSLLFSFVLFVARSLHAETLVMVVSEFKDATRLSPNLGPSPRLRLNSSSKNGSARFGRCDGRCSRLTQGRPSNCRQFRG